MRIDQIHKEKIWRCDCIGGSHFISITRWLDDPEGYMILEAADHHQGILNRIKAAYNIIRYGQHMWFEICLNPTMTDEICEELKEISKQIQPVNV